MIQVCEVSSQLETSLMESVQVPAVKQCDNNILLLKVRLMLILQLISISTA